MRTDPRRAVTLLIVVGTLLRLAWAAALEPSNDEAYHWLYTVHPALSYFDHPPMTMWVEQVGLALCGGRVHPLSLRLGFVLLFAGSTWVTYRWAAGCYGERAGFWAAVALNLSGYFTAFGGIFALPDSPFLFFAQFTFWRVTVAIRSQGFGLPRASGERDPFAAGWRQTKENVYHWFLVGVGFGGAMLSKYHAVLLPAGVVLYALITPTVRRLLWSPGPYLAVLIGFALFTPVVVWNAQHEWASFLFQGGRARDTDTIPFLHEGPLKWLAGPILYLLPWIWFWLVLELGRGVRRFRTLDEPDRLLLCLAVVPLGFFFVISGLSRSVLLHWPLVGFLPLYPLLGRNWVRLRDRYPRTFFTFVTLWALTILAFAGAIIAQSRYGVIVVPTKGKDAAADISGWESVAEELDRRGVLNEPGVFLFTNIWYDSGQLAFAIRNRVPVACYHTFDARGFAFWSKPTDYLGKTAYFVVADEQSRESSLREFGPFFRGMTPAFEFQMTRHGRPFRPVTVYRCEHQTQPYPFDFKMAETRRR